MLRRHHTNTTAKTWVACGNSHLACEWIRVHKLSQRYVLGICAVWCVWGCTDGGGLYVPCRYLHTAGIEIVHENANFCGSKTDFPQRKTIVPGETKLAVQKKKGGGGVGRREAPGLVRHQIPANIRSVFTCSCHPSLLHNCEHSHMLLLSQAGNRLEHSHS